MQHLYKLTWLKLCWITVYNVHLYSIQIIADADHNIMYVDATVPGSQNDQFVFDQSNLRIAIDGGHLRDYQILADSG